MHHCEFTVNELNNLEFCLDTLSKSTVKNNASTFETCKISGNVHSLDIICALNG